MEDFEQKVARLEELSEAIKQPNVSLEDALKTFEEGIKLAGEMKKYLDEMEAKVQILMNPQAMGTTGDQSGESPQPAASKGGKSGAKEGRAHEEAAPVLGLFDETSEVRGTRS